MVKITPDTVRVSCPIAEKKGERHDIDRDKSRPNHWFCKHCGNSFSDTGLQIMRDEIDDERKNKS